MYIAEIEEILNETLNNFVGTWILEKKTPELLDFKKISKEPNFVKFQKEINQIIEFGQSIIPDKRIDKLVSKKQNYLLIKNVISKYLSYYLFIMIGLNYNGKLELFNNNIIEFSRNQVNFSVKIDGFFNTESNSNIIKQVNLINEFKDYIDKINGKNKNPDLLDNYSYQLKDFVNQLGVENVKENIAGALSGQKDQVIVDHSIILMIIQLNLLTDKEKNEIFDIIESTETSSGDFIFIDVVVPRSDFIDFNAIESILSPAEIKTSLPETIYHLINEDYSDDVNEKRKYFTDHDLKIQKLLDTHIIIPIVDDFLLYHKDNEKYEKQGDKSEPKKKDDTKIKYIINKINTVSEFYKNPSEFKKLFYLPLQEDNAVLINTYEDVKVVSKIKNITKIEVETLDLINDLMTYRAYPYVSFKDFKNNGFIFSSDSTVDALRNVSFDLYEKKKYDVLSTRVVSQDMLVNIVGFAFVNKETELNCINTKSFIDIGKETNEPLNVIKTLIDHKIKKSILKDEFLETSRLNNNYFWLFDLSKQKYNIPFYDISDSMPKNEVVKIITAYLYDYMIESIIKNIQYNVKNSHPKLITYYVDNLQKYKSIYPDITNPQHSKDLNELEYLMYYAKSLKTDDTYDYNEDEFPGLYGNIKKLPTAPPKKYPPIPVLKVPTDFKEKDKENSTEIVIKESEINQADYDSQGKNYINAVCQHIISWDKIGELKKLNTATFTDLVYEFIQQYVDVNVDQDFVCKSCKSAINIKKYIQDGQFDNTTQNFVSFSIQMDVNIEDLPEYEKYKTSIRGIDKIIDRMASIFNLQAIKGITWSARTKRRNIVKDVIDIVTNHNIYLKKKYLVHRDALVSSYGINKNLSNFFIFELDNNIFVYSTKDKDYYKMIKYNNVLTYILINLILDINDSQILSLIPDKFCSYYIYKKVGFSIFENLKIIINKSRDLKPITDYPILCYVIFLLSCLMTKYHIWVDIISKEVKPADKKKPNPTLQKSIIHTLVELLNSILFVDAEAAKEHKNYIYEILQTKYYFKLDLFKSTDLTRKLDKMYLQEFQTKETKYISLDSNKFDLVPNNDVFNKLFHDDLYDRFSKKYSLQRFVTKFYVNKMPNTSLISNLTNCMSGNFHNFKPNGNLFTCTICGENADPSNFVPDSVKLLYTRYIIVYLRKLATKYCIDGSVHKFVYDPVKDINVCSHCKYVYGTPIMNSDKELFSMFDIVEKNKKENNILFDKYVGQLKLNNTNEINKFKKIFDKIMYKFQKYDSDINKSVEIILDSVQKLLGTDVVVNTKVYNLYHNIYYIDHDYNGVKLESPIQVYEKEGKFRIIENHPHFKRSVIVYTMQKNTRYELFYDLQEKFLMGYREVNKEYNDIDPKQTFAKLQVNYSVKTMLLEFGLPRQKVNIIDFYPEIIGMSTDDFKRKISENPKFLMKDFIDKACTKRFNLIKKMGYELSKYVYRFKYNYKVNLITTEYVNLNTEQTNVVYEPSNNPLDLLYVKYNKKLDSDIITESTDAKTTHIFLKYINDIINYMPFHFKFNSKSDELKFSTYIDNSFIIKNDVTSNIVLNYVLDEFSRIIQYNSNKTTKTNLTHFLLDIIIIMYNEHNKEVALFDKRLGHFNQILYTSEFYLETQNADLMVDAIDYYSNQHTLKEVNNMDDENREKVIDELENDVEELEALDIGDEILDEEGRFDLYSNYEFIDNIKEMISENILPPGDYY